MSDLNRRTALTTIATLPALAVPAAAIAAVTSHPDAELLELGREFDRQVSVLNDCSRRVGETYEIATGMMAPIPDSLRPKAGDRRLVPAPTSVNVGQGMYGANDMGSLRRIANDTDFFTAARSRAREIVRDYELWETDHDDALEKSGHMAAEEEHTLHHDALDIIDRQIIAMPAHTIEGLKVKARVVFWCRQGEIDDREDGECTDIKTALSIVTDLMRMQGRAPMTAVEYDAEFCGG